MVTIWNAHALALARHNGRGGAPKSKYPWESTISFPGVKFKTEVAANKEKLEQHNISEITTSSKGIYAVLIKTWADMREHKAASPQMLIFPGHCASTLRRLGAPSDKLTEMQFAVADPDDAEIERKNVTTLALTDAAFTYGANITEVAAPLESSVELVLEVDERWTMPRISTEMEKDFRATLSHMAGRLTYKTIDADFLYQAREVNQKPARIWMAKLRLSAGDGEKLVCASGREALFVRPSVPAMLQSSDKYTIIWSKRHGQASPSLLAELLQRADKVQAHRGLAHSLVAVGLRAPWLGIESARKAFAFDDPRFRDETFGLRDVYQFVLEGVPPHAEAKDLTNFLHCAGWKAIPHRRRIFKGVAQWRVSAASEPPEKLYRWQEMTIVVRLANEDEIHRKQKIQEHQARKGEGETTQASFRWGELHSTSRPSIP